MPKGDGNKSIERKGKGELFQGGFHNGALLCSCQVQWWGDIMVSGFFSRGPTSQTQPNPTQPFGGCFWSIVNHTPPPPTL